MSVSAKFLTFSKKVNSTAQPTLTGATNFDIVFKMPCSMEEPTIKLETSNPTAFNYCYIDIFNRYYYVRDWTSINNGIWEASLKVDALGSFKSEVIAESHYVLRSASASDGDIVDGLYPTNGLTDILLGGMTTSSPFSSADLTSVIGIINNNTSNKFGAAQLYTISESSLGSLMSYLLGGTQGGTTIMDEISAFIAPLANQDVQNAIARSLINPAQFITESYMLPYAPPTSGPAHALKCGWYNPPAGVGKTITSGASDFFITSGTLTLPDHPQASTRGRYLNLSPYMKYWLYLGPFGIYPLDANTVYNDRSVAFNINGDINGNVICKLYVDTKLIDILHANVKCSFPVAQTTFNVGGAAQSMIGAAASVGRIAAGDVTGIASGLSNILNAAEANFPHVTTIGNQGSMTNVFDNFYAYAEAHYIVDEMNAERGRPYCRSVTLSSLSGYCLCSDAEVSITGTEQEASEINNYLNSGFFIE